MSVAYSARALFLLDCLDLELATGFEGARWEPFQLAMLNDDGTFRIENKSRQIAWSWTIAAEAVAQALLAGESSIFVSINLQEAKEKIRYARAVYDSLRPDVRDANPLLRNNAFGLEFANAARLDSMPARPPRGRARTNVYLDEFAHVQFDRDIYQAALPIISKGGRLRIGSSPLGARGMFWEVFSESMRPYSGYTRRSTPWWAVYSFCVDVPEALRVAWGMLTKERVERFGKPRIQQIYQNMPLEDFQCEYETLFVEENTAVFTWDEIQAMQAAGEGLACFMAAGRGNAISQTLDALPLVKQAIREQKVEGVLYGGVDIGRTRDTTEIYLVGQTTTGALPLRLALTLDACEFDAQETVLTAVLTQLPVVRMTIDQTGLGRNLAENLAKRFPSKVVGADFTGASKQLWVGDAKMLCQQGKLALPADRDLAYQIHSLKRIVTASKHLVFDTDRSEKHHADRAWAWMLALASAVVKGVEPASARGRTVSAGKLGLE